MTDTVKICSRPGCGKQLRRTNTVGACATGCLSAEAPASQRRKDTRYRPRPGYTPPTDGAVLGRFRTVCAALKIDPDAELEVFAQAWLDGLREKVTEGGGES